MSRRLITVGVAATLAIGATAPSAQALDQLVSGTTLSTLALTAATPAVFASLSPGGTATSTGGTLIATSTSPSWSVTAKDQAGGAPGHLVAAGVGCTGSAPSLGNAVSVTVTPLVANGAITSAGAKSISATNATVVSATNALLAATVFDTSFQQIVATNELLTAGCVYTMTATYTIQ